MSKKGKGRILATMRARPHKGRGDLYRWLFDHHQEIVLGFKKTNSSWDTVILEAVAQGVTGRAGSVPNRKSITRVWARVCADIVALADVRTSKARNQPPPRRSRADGSWHPRVVAPGAPQPFARPPENDKRASQDDWLPRPINSQGPMALPSTDRQPVSEEEVEARLAKLRRTFAERSGH